VYHPNKIIFGYLVRTMTVFYSIPLVYTIILPVVVCCVLLFCCFGVVNVNINVISSDILDYYWIIIVHPIILIKFIA
jgi:hypothetical protein